MFKDIIIIVAAFAVVIGIICVIVRPDPFYALFTDTVPEHPSINNPNFQVR